MSDKSLTHGKQVILQEGDKIISDTNEICEIFNTYFTSVANNIGFDDLTFTPKMVFQLW